MTEGCSDGAGSWVDLFPVNHLGHLNSFSSLGFSQPGGHSVRVEILSLCHLSFKWIKVISTVSVFALKVKIKNIRGEIETGIKKKTQWNCFSPAPSLGDQ